MWDWIVRHKQGNGNWHMHVGGKKKTYRSEFFYLTPNKYFRFCFCCCHGDDGSAPQTKKRRRFRFGGVPISMSQNINIDMNTTAFWWYVVRDLLSTALRINCKMQVRLKALAFSYFSSLLYSRLYSPPPPNQW